MKKMKCLRCLSDMQYIATKEIQLGKTSWLLGDLPNLIAGSMQLSVYSCKNCGKIEFFQADGEDEKNDSSLAQMQCPNCGKKHDIDYPKCPFCNYSYIKR